MDQLEINSEMYGYDIVCDIINAKTPKYIFNKYLVTKKYKLIEVKFFYLEFEQYKKKTEYKCVCGSEIKFCNKQRHEKSKDHIKFISKK